tara:strand:- start:1201 stop:1380 length:180 start_codon:yes stop_codon:yes gene_type:complete
MLTVIAIIIGTLGIHFLFYLYFSNYVRNNHSADLVRWKQARMGQIKNRRWRGLNNELFR